MNTVLLVIFSALCIAGASAFPIHHVMSSAPDNKRHGIVNLVNTIYASASFLWPVIVLWMHKIFKTEISYLTILMMIPSIMFIMQIKMRAVPRQQRINENMNRSVSNSAVLSIISGAVLALGTCFGALHLGPGSKFITSAVVGAFMSSFLLIEPRSADLNTAIIRNEIFTILLTMLFTTFIYGIVLKGAST